MSYLHEKKSQWLLELNPGDKTMLYQPKVIPMDELSLVEKTLKNHPVEKAFYTRISVNTNGQIMDYHLIAYEPGFVFIVDDLLKDLSSIQRVLADFKFLDLSTNAMLAKQIRRGENFYKK